MKKKFTAALFFGATSALVVGLAASQLVWATVPGTNSLVSTTSAGVQANQMSNGSDTSSDGKFTVFHSAATNLVASDTNAMTDVFIKDNITGVLSLVSVSTGGTQANQDSYSPWVSSTGRYVVFYSSSTNLDATVSSTGIEAFIRDTVSGTTTLVSEISGAEGNGSSYPHDVSDDGRYVLLSSEATNLVTGDTNGKRDIFVKDMVTGTMELISKDASGALANNSSFNPKMSCDGAIIAFYSVATNLVTGDTNARGDVFVVNRVGSHLIENITILGDQNSAGQDVSCEGSYISFQSDATNLVASDTNSATDIFLYSRVDQSITRVSEDSSGSQSNNYSTGASVSDHGYYVTYDSPATNLVTGDTNAKSDVFIKDMRDMTNQILSQNTSGVLGNNTSAQVRIGADGSTASFYSEATNLVGSDTNGKGDVFQAISGF